MSAKLVTIATFATGVEADLARSVLEEEGVRCFLADETSVDMLWHLGNAIGGVKLQVPEPEVDLAREILARREAEPVEDVDPSQESLAPDSDQDLEVAVAMPGDETAARAWRAAVIGSFCLPLVLHFYSGILLVLIALRGQPLSPVGERRFYLALLVDLVVAALAGLVFYELRK